MLDSSIPIIIYPVVVLTLMLVAYSFNEVYIKTRSMHGCFGLLIGIGISLLMTSIAGGICAAILIGINTFSPALAWLVLIGGLIIGVAIYRFKTKSSYQYVPDPSNYHGVNCECSKCCPNKYGR
jgi:hypothetical protein